MQQSRSWKPSLQQAVHPFPTQPMLVAPAQQLLSPESAESFSKHPQAVKIARHRVIVEVTLHDRLEPLTRFRHQLMPTRRQLRLDGLQLGSQALGRGLASNGKVALPILPTDVGEA